MQGIADATRRAKKAELQQLKEEVGVVTSYLWHIVVVLCLTYWIVFMLLTAVSTRKRIKLQWRSRMPKSASEWVFIHSQSLVMQCYTLYLSYSVFTGYGMSEANDALLVNVCVAAVFWARESHAEVASDEKVYRAGKKSFLYRHKCSEKVWLSLCFSVVIVVTGTW